MVLHRLTPFSMNWLCAGALALSLGACATAPTAVPPAAAPVLAASAAGATPCGMRAEQLDRVRQLTFDAVSRGYAPGMVTSVHCEGKPVLSVVAGRAEGMFGRASKEDDLFRVYSMTKPITVLAAMILIDDGRMGLDDPVAKFIPEFAATRAYAGGDTVEAMRTEPLKRAITVRDLMRHTAGITYISDAPHPVHRLYKQRGIDHGAGNVITPTDGSKPIADAKDLAVRIAGIPALFQPGERFSYGNSNDVLGHVVAVASGQSLRDFMAARIFAPLGMRDTFFQIPVDKMPRFTAAHAARSSEPGVDLILRNTRSKDLTQGASMQVEAAAGSIFSKPRAIDYGGAGLVSTAADYQRFLLMMLGGGELDGKRIVSRQGAAEMVREQLSPQAMAAPKMASQGLGYGLGFGRFSNPEKLPYAVPKDGYFWGGAASTYFWVDPARKITGVVMSQVFGGDVMPFYLDMMDAIYAPSR